MIVQYGKVNVVSVSLVLCFRQKPHDNPEEPYKMERDVAFTYTVEEKE